MSPRATTARPRRRLVPANRAGPITGPRPAISKPITYVLVLAGLGGAATVQHLIEALADAVGI